jgi:hypothetical protein
MIDVKDKKTNSLFKAGRPRKFKDDAEKMRQYRFEKRIKKIIDTYNIDRLQAIK